MKAKCIKLYKTNYHNEHSYNRDIHAVPSQYSKDFNICGVPGNIYPVVHKKFVELHPNLLVSFDTIIPEYFEIIEETWYHPTLDTNYEAED